MIPQSKIEEIIRAASIEEVVGDYVRLKRRGSSLTGLCPFHNEKTPSFSVSPAKGVFKCFGCGKAGNVVNFVMEHDSLGYIQALKQLAEKYQIDWPEQEFVNPDEERKQMRERESLQVVNDWAAHYFEQLLWEHEEGKNIGLAYFEERGFRHDIIKKFRLGYSLESWTDLYDEAVKNTFNEEILIQSGLVKEKEPRGRYDAYRGRVMFPIHGLNGKIIAFAGRHLISDPKSPKYVNSPETVLYHKSNELYGLHFAKNSIRQNDQVYLVEGYTDVISMHQAGVENVVASSGTSLTENQIKSIKRFTENVIVLYDGDNAGIKASLRGIDMLLEQGLNVRVLLFPDGDDPDSFSRKVKPEEFRDYLHSHANDFILFKTRLLLGDVQNDPLKKAAVIRDIVESIVKIPDAFKRAAFLKECSSLLDVSEQLLMTEANKLRRNFLKEHQRDWVAEPIESAAMSEEFSPIHIETDEQVQEKDIIRLLIKYGNQPYDSYLNVAHFILNELEDIVFNFNRTEFLAVVHECKQLLSTNTHFTSEHFIYNPNPEISHIAADALTEKLEISPNWQKRYNIIVENKDDHYISDIRSSIGQIKLKYIDKEMHRNMKNLSEANDDESIALYQNVHQILIEQKKDLASLSGIVVQRWLGNHDNPITPSNTD